MEPGRDQAASSGDVWVAIITTGVAMLGTFALMFVAGIAGVGSPVMFYGAPLLCLASGALLALSARLGSIAFARFHTQYVIAWVVLAPGLLLVGDIYNTWQMQEKATERFLTKTGLTQLPRGCVAGPPYRQMGYTDFECDGDLKEATDRMRASLDASWAGPTRGPLGSRVFAKSRAGGVVEIFLRSVDGVTKMDSVLEHD